MQTRVEPFTGDFPPGAMGLGPEGWRPEHFEKIHIDLRGYTLDEAMVALSMQHGGLLGEGALVFLELPEERQTGYVVFIPA